MTDRDLIASVYCPPPARAPWRLEDLVPNVPIAYFSFARRALAEGLRAAGVSEGDAVLLPEFICRDLLSSLAAVGARPEYYPVDAGLNPALPPSRWPAAKAVVAVNYFGFPQDLSPFQDYCRERGAILIEDNAHGLFSRDAEGRLLGTRGDMGLFSLRKTLPLPDGAALVLMDPSRGWKLEKNRRPDAPEGTRRLLKRSYRLLARGLGPAVAFGGLSLLRNARSLRTGRRAPPPDPDSELCLPLPENPSAQLGRPIAVAGPEEETARRRGLYRLFSERLGAAGFKPVFEDLPESISPYAFPFRASEKEFERAAALLARWSVEPLTWPDLPAAVQASAPAHYRDVKLVHFLW